MLSSTLPKAFENASANMHFCDRCLCKAIVFALTAFLEFYNPGKTMKITAIFFRETSVMI